MKTVKDQFYEMENARENWYRDILVEAVEIGFFNEADFLEKDWTKIRQRLDNAQLEYSNDFICDKLMKLFIEKCQFDQVKNELDRIWIGVSDEDESINAMAYFINPDFDGYLIKYTNKLKLLVRKVTEFISANLLLFGSINAKDENLFYNVLRLRYYTLQQLFDDAFSMKIHNYLKGDLYSHREEFDKLLGRIYAIATGFIIAHEIGHHLLDHTKYFHLIPFISRLCREDIDIEGHKKEFDSDSFAIHLLYSSLLEDNREKLYEGQYVFLFGPLIVMLAISLLNEEPNKDSVSHPSVKSRFKCIMNTMKIYATESDFQWCNEAFKYICDSLVENYSLWNGERWWE